MKLFVTSNLQPPISNPWSRRAFFRHSALAAGVLAGVPSLVPSTVLGANAPSRRIHLGHIGVGGRGSALLGAFLALPESRSMAVCDCFEERRRKARDAIREKYQDAGCATYTDLREMLARDDLDGVVIATPDHWHVPAALLAVRAGKHVYVEKPLGLSVEQGHLLRAACARHGAAFQYGTQQRSSNHIRFGCELVRNGRLGKLRSVEVVSPASSKGGSTTPLPVPENLDYQQWLGPAPLAPYTKDRCTSSGAWFISDYALGFIAGWGAHPLDVMVWALGDQPDAVPVELEGRGNFPTNGLFDTATAWEIRGKFANGVDFHFRGPGENLTVFTGDQGQIRISRAALETEPESVGDAIIGPEETHLVRSDNHYRNFVEAIRSGRPTVSPIHAAVFSDTISHLGDITLRTGRKIRWDTAKETISGDEAAARMLRRAMRAPWTT